VRLVAVMVPPCRATTRAEMDRPKPLPWGWLSLVPGTRKKGVKRFCKDSAGTPGPQSSTDSVMLPE
jgi:hypothetical protein